MNRRMPRCLAALVLIVATSASTWADEARGQGRSDTRLRVLLDWSISKPYGTREGLLSRYLDDKKANATYWTFGWPSRSGLDRFDVLIIDSVSIFAYPPDEVKAIVAFVQAGGGLLLAGHGSRYVEEARGSHGPQNYPLNRLADPLGAFFQDARATVPLHVQKNDLVPIKTSWEQDSHLGPPDRGPAVLRVSKDYRVLFADSQNRPVVAVREFGKGRVAVIADIWFMSHPDERVSQKRVNEKTISSLFQWLGKSRCGRGTLPDDQEIRGPILFKDERFRVYGVEPLRPHAQRLHHRAAGCYREIVKVVGHESPKTYNLFALPEVPGGGMASGRADGPIVAVGVICPTHADEGRMTLFLAHEIAHTFIQGRLAGLEESFASLAAYRAVGAQRMDLSWAERDPQNPMRLEAWPRKRFEEADPDHKGIHMAAQRQPPDLEGAAFGKGMWVIESLEQRFGPDFMSRYFQLLETEGVNRPLSLDDVAGYMGRVAGEDVKPWFRSSGTWRSGGAAR